MVFWSSVHTLRKIEFFLTLIVITVPMAGGAALLSLRHRIKTLLTQSSQGEDLLYQGNMHSLRSEKDRIRQELTTAREELGSLRRMTAPRQLSEEQERIFVEKLRHVKASPVIVAGYPYEEESLAYAAQIAKALQSAGWEATFNKASMNDFKGICLGSVNLMRKPLLGVRELAEAFSAAHIETRQREIDSDSIAGALQDGSILVVVGRK